MRLRLAVSVLLVLLVSLVAVASATASGDDADVYVVHGVPGVPVDVYVDGEPVAALADFQPAEVRGPLALPAGSYTIDLRAAGAPADAEPALTGAVDIPAHETVSLVAHYDDAGALTLSAFVEDTSVLAPGTGRLTVRHAADAPEVDIRAAGSPIFTGVPNGAQGTIDLPADTYEADVVAAGTDTVVLGPADLDVREGALLVVYAIGQLDEDTLGLAVQTIDDLAVRATDRIAGETRIETAVEISKRAYPDGAPAVYLSRANVFADALAAKSLTDGPVLLVPSCSGVPPVVQAEIERLNPERVVALGGQLAVCDATLAEAADF